MEAEVKRRLLQRGVQATSAWLDACMEFFINSDEQYDSKGLETVVFNQWLLIDLRDMKIASFPPNLKDKRKIVLTGHYTCQIESVLDIGHSAYSQYQKISKKDNTNLEVDTDKDPFQKKWEPKSSKSMFLYICDGVQEIRAMEFRAIPALNTSIVPGTKVIIKGPVICRRGIIMLENGNVELLGGEVDKLLTPNAYENILATCLELPLNMDPYRLGGGTGAEEPQTAQAAQQIVEEELRPARQEENRRVRSPPQRTHVAVQNTSRQPYQPIEDDLVDDEAFLNIDLDFETEFRGQPNIQSQFRDEPNIQSHGESASNNTRQGTGQDRPNVPPHRPKTANVNRTSKPGPLIQQSLQAYGIGASRKPQPGIERLRSSSNTQQSVQSPKYVIEDDDEDILLAFDMIDSGVSSSGTLSKDSAQPSTSRSEQKSTATYEALNDDFDMDDDLCILEQSIDDEALSRLENAHFQDRNEGVSNEAHQECVPHPEKIPVSPFVYLSHVKDILGTTTQRKKVWVKAVIVKVTEKICVTDGEWRLGVQISDGSAKLAVRFSSEVVTSIFKLTPAELSIRKKAAGHDPAKKAELKKHFERGQVKLLHINSIFEMELVPDQDPLVVDIQEMTAKHVDELRKRSLPK